MTRLYSIANNTYHVRQPMSVCCGKQKDKEARMKRIAEIIFTEAFNDDSKRYHYFTDDNDLKTGDVCVVDSGPGLGVATVQRFVKTSDKAHAWVVQKIDMVAHADRLKRQQEIEDIKSNLENLRKDFEEKRIWEVLASDNPVAAKLLDTLKKLED
jgi:hypothetical protein